MQTTTKAARAVSETGRRVFRVAELEKWGISQSASYRHVRADGPWTRLAPGIALVVPGEPTLDDRIQAALLRAGPGAMVTGFHAARLHGLETPSKDADIHILIPHGRKIQSYPGVRYERTTRLPQPVYIEGVPTAPVTRAVMDGARTWQTFTFTRRLLFEAIMEKKGCRADELTAEMEAGCRRGTGLPRAILRAFRSGLTSTGSQQEHAAPPDFTPQQSAA
ncbi:hypothetical protein GCM10011581_47390 [Saccharopolyspora subtropica]|uniref:Uncharacterized protein n=1 Tax=Saccharopolyspora thermophila TaxID=89367 RepID=A0A917K8G6_9PSEU|nr:hypothetical protein [Saccharopolyspora subtropica]GGJ04877.1 hypothetical protein GCM10011581_47390 [Saccharopolyspora subtropica]